MDFKIYFLFFPLIVLKLTACDSHEQASRIIYSDSTSTYDFAGDSIWIKTYRKIHNGLMAPTLRAVLLEIAEEYQYKYEEIAFFNLLIQNADCEHLTIYHFLVKYPFANPAYVIEKYQEMMDIGLLTKKETYYTLTEKGKQLCKAIESQIKAQKIDNETVIADLVSVLSKISKNARQEAFTGINWSLKSRENASLRFEGDTAVFPRLVCATRDLIALINDQAHYGLYFLNGKYDYLNISRAENELLGSAWWNGHLNPDTFQARLTWGYDLEETNAFIESLLAKDLLTIKDSLLVPSVLGTAIIDEASQHTDLHFFEPWTRLSKSELDLLITFLNEEANEN